MTIPTRRLLVTGSRGWTDAIRVRAVLDQIADEAVAGGTQRLIVVHGAAYPAPRNGRRPAVSADWLAHRWALDLPHPLTVAEDARPAAWDTCDVGGYPPCPRRAHRQQRASGGSYCPLAGKRRNALMVTTLDRHRDHAVAFQLNGSSGTQDCIDRIREANIPLTLITEKR